MPAPIQLEKIWDLLKFNPDDPLLFHTSLFFFLFVGFLILYNIVSKYKSAKFLLIILFSLYFYYKSAGYLAAILIVSAVVNFSFGALIYRTPLGLARRLYFILAIVINVGILAYFKYTNFIIQIINEVQRSQIEPLNIFLPIGISFYTFKAMSYIIDIYMEMMEPTKSFRNFCVFIFFFPNIQLGPIERASNFLPQLEEDYQITNADIGRALFLISTGLLKLALISDYLNANFISQVFDWPERYTGFQNLIATYAYSLQLYCDFSGYSDLAIGIALLMGYKLMDNFNAPFKATSIADFWRRWHISLSRWLLDYLFKPLQIKFRRLKMASNIISLFITFIICGIWHNAGWNFVIWGALHGFYMSVGILLQKPKTFIYKKLGIYNTAGLRFVQRVITFHLIAFSFLIFRFTHIEKIKAVLVQIFTYFHGEIYMQFIEKLPVITALIITGFLFHFFPEKAENKIKSIMGNMPIVGKVLLLAVVVYIVAQFKSANPIAPTYFQY